MNEIAETKIVDVDKLLPRYADQETNPNRMEPEKYDLLVRAIQQEGFLQPILVTPISDKKGHWRIEDGHHRWWAAKQAGLKQVSISIKKIEEDLLVAGQAMLIGIGMNRLRGELDLGIAADIIREVQNALSMSIPDVSVLTGFTEEELSTLLSNNTEPEEILNDGAGAVNDVEVEEGKTFVLEISFEDREQYKLAKRKLRRLGKGTLSVGLMIALGEDGE